MGVGDRRQFTVEKLLNIGLKTFLFFLPWQTILILKEQLVNGTKWEYGTLGFYATEILLWMTIILFMVWYLQKAAPKFSIFNFQFSKDRVFLFFSLFFICYSLASILWAGDKDVALQHALYVIEGFLLFIILFVGPLSKSEIAKWVVYGSIIPSILGIAQFIFQTTWESKWLGLAVHDAWQAGTSIIASDSIGRWLRAYGPFSHPNVFGGYLMISIIGSLFLMERFKDLKIIHQRRIRLGRKRLPLLLSYSLQLTAIFFTFSRSAWIAFGTVILLYCYLAFKHHVSHIRYHLSFTFLIIALLTTVYFPLIQTRFAHESISEIRSTEERVSGYSEALVLFKENPWIGVGAGNYTVAQFGLHTGLSGWQLQPVHNVFLLCIVELGIVGFVLLSAVFVSYIMYHVTYNKRFGVFLWLIPYLLFLVFDHYLLSSYSGIMLSSVFFALVCRLSPGSPPDIPKTIENA